MYISSLWFLRNQVYESFLTAVALMVYLGLLAILIIFTVRAFTSFVIPTISAKLSTSALLDLRHDLTQHILRLPQSYFDKTSSGELILRLVNQVQELSTFVGQTTVKAMRDTATVVIVSGYLVYKNILLFSIALVVTPTYSVFDDCCG